MASASDIIFTDRYSTEEICTGSYWIDGKLIYRKTLDVGYITGASPKIVPHNIPNIDRIIKIEGFARRDSGYTMMLPHVSTTEVQGINIGGSSTAINIYHNYPEITLYYAYVTISYTKTTD